MIRCVRSQAWYVICQKSHEGEIKKNTVSTKASMFWDTTLETREIQKKRGEKRRKKKETQKTRET